jgi:uncharacterized protein (TIGR03083 family)
MPPTAGTERHSGVTRLGRDTYRVDTDEYEAVRERVVAVTCAGDPDMPVPACPGWRVRDVVAHLTGLCEDWTHHRLDGYASDEWTAVQVSRFEGHTLEEVHERWRLAARQFARLDDDPVMGPPARWAFGDAITHEADIRGALGAGRVPRDAVMLALKGSIARWRETLRDAGAPTLLLLATDAREWWLGTPDDSRATVAEAWAYEIFRALAGRRSIDQVRAWTWSADPDPYLATGLPYPFRWADADVSD